jgi:hypothetical protein
MGVTAGLMATGLSGAADALDTAAGVSAFPVSRCCVPEEASPRRSCSATLLRILAFHFLLKMNSYEPFLHEVPD